MRYIVTINNKDYEVEVEKGQATLLKVGEAEPGVPSTVQTAARAAASQAAARNTAAAPQSPAPAAQGPAKPVGKGTTVSAPMPGTILSVKVSTGQAVKRGDILFILEAMKMENEIVSPIDGVVAQITAAKDSTVSTGDILAVIQ